MSDILPKGTYEYDYDGKLGTHLVDTLPDDPFKPGDRVMCCKGFVSKFNRKYPITSIGDEFTVRAYLRTHNYLFLEELQQAGWVNMGRFIPV
jgi:hypothetical protein